MEQLKQEVLNSLKTIEKTLERNENLESQDLEVILLSLLLEEDQL